MGGRSARAVGSPPLGVTLVLDSGGVSALVDHRARLEELRRRQASFVGHIEALSTRDDSGSVAIVHLTVRVTLTTNDAPPDPRVRFYQVRLGRDAAGGRWLVARAEQS